VKSGLYVEAGQITTACVEGLVVELHELLCLRDNELTVFSASTMYIIHLMRHEFQLCASSEAGALLGRREESSKAGVTYERWS